MCNLFRSSSQRRRWIGAPTDARTGCPSRGVLALAGRLSWRLHCWWPVESPGEILARHYADADNDDTILPPWRRCSRRSRLHLVAMVVLVLASSSQEKSLLGIVPVPSTTTFEDVAFLLGGIDERLLALLLVLSATLKVKAGALPRSSLFMGEPHSSSLLFMGEAALAVGCYHDSMSVLLWRLCFVDALLVGGAIKSNAGWCFHRFRHSPSRIPPLGQHWMAVRGTRMCCQMSSPVYQFQGRSS